MRAATMTVHLISFTPDPDYIIMRAARCCVGVDQHPNEATNPRFIQARIKEGHESILEHATVTFRISGISRACTHQLVRHRIASYSQESQRYVSPENRENFEAVIPESIKNNTDALAVFALFMEQCADCYDQLRKLNIAKEDARFVLPNATETKIIVTMNFRQLRHFFKERCVKNAQWEIREMAKLMLNKCLDVCPSVFCDLQHFLTNAQ